MDLNDWLLTQADADGELTEAAKLAVLAALDGETALDDALGGAYARPAPSADDDAVSVPAARAFLESISVSGFRGIGPRAQLALDPAPGLVVVAGRNGSGKSTFAEALEVAVTGNTYRGAKNIALWRENWRNMHRGEPCAIEVRFAVEGRGRTTVGVDWTASAELDDRSVWVQRAGGKRVPGLESLGWERPLELFPPLLSYDELSGMLEGKPSQLHDALESFLGLEQLTDALRRLSDRVKVLREPQRQVKEAKDALKPTLETLDDERARTVLAQVKKRTAHDLDAVRAVLSGSSSTDPAVARLAAISAVSIPGSSDAELASTALADAAMKYGATTEQVSQASVDRIELLEHALRFHREVGDVACPVCDKGLLDAEWAARAEAASQTANEQQRLLSDARARLRDARDGIGRFLGVVDQLSSVVTDDLPTAPQLRAALEVLRAAPDDTVLLAAHVRAEYPRVVESFDRVRSEAESELARRQDRWADVVVRVAAWVAAVEEAASVAVPLSTAEAAEKWVKSNLAQLRNERLEPFAEQSRVIWAELRQESNVDLGSIRLEGANTRRRVDLTARVDGSDAGALAVMSQGELHALALALFIPRAAAEASPFGFVVLDDPIQAMDPSKVDGFVKVLVDLAQHRQVIVLSHDDRLPESLRRSRANARILEIERGTGSVVSVANGSDPARRYIDDARAVARDTGLSDADKARVIPGLCRMSIEAVCRDRYFAARIGAGDTRSNVEQTWDSTPKTRDRVMLVVQPASGNLDVWLKAKAWRRPGLKVCTSAVHTGLRGDARAAVEDVARCVDDLRAHP